MAKGVNWYQNVSNLIFLNYLLSNMYVSFCQNFLTLLSNQYLLLTHFPKISILTQFAITGTILYIHYVESHFLESALALRNVQNFQEWFTHWGI